MAHHPGVFLFVQHGCPACDEFLPRFKHVVAPARARGVPIGIYDVARDRKAAAFAAKLGINATPTMMVLARDGRLRRYIGGVSNMEVTRAIAAI